MLLASAVSLIIGPLLFKAFASRQHFYRLMDGFIVVVITGIVIIEVVPEVVAHMPYLGFLMIGLGFAGPTILERLFHKVAHQVHKTALMIGMLGIILHAVVDGFALWEISQSGGELLGWGLILHRLPVGITVWWLLEPRYGRNAAAGVLGLMVLATFGGFFMGMEMTHLVVGESGLGLKAFVAGAILHVVVHRPHASDHIHAESHRNSFFKWAEGAGNLIGFGVLALILASHGSGHAGHGHMQGHNHNLLSGETISIFWGMALESAPALLLAYFFGGLISEFLPAASVRWMQKGPAIGRSLKGMAVGLPLPICTCGVLPLYQTLIKKGVPASAAMAFLIATPELGIDAILISIPLLGGDMTMVRLVAAATIALLIGWLVGKWTETATPTEHTEEVEKTKESKGSLGHRFSKGMREGFGGLVDDTAPWILAGLFVAALAHPVLGQGWLQELPGVLEVLVFALIGLPVYVCASGATPIVAVLLINGVSPGAALAFLLTGPATNVSTFGILAQLHNRTVAIVFGIATMFFAVSLGLLVDTLLPNLSLLSASDLNLEEWSLLQQVSLILLMSIFLYSLLRRGARAFVGEVTSNFRFGGVHVHTHEPVVVSSRSDHVQEKETNTSRVMEKTNQNSK